MYFSLKGAPRDLLKKLSEHLRPMPQKAAKPLAAQVAAQVSRVPANTFHAVIARLKESNWEAPVEQVCKHVSTAADARRSDVQIMKTLVSEITEIISNAYEGGSDFHLLRRLEQLRRYGVDCGDKFHSPEFFRLVEDVTAQAKLFLDAEDFNQALSGLGVSSHFSVLFDSVSLGSSTWSRHDTLLVVGVSFVSPVDGRLHARLFAAPSSGQSHKGPATASLVLENLSRHPAGVDEKMMKRRLTAIGGDGVVIKGGASARHGSTNAGSCFWKLARGEDEECIEWDPFHREDVARKRAFRASPLTTELFCLYVPAFRDGRWPHHFTIGS